MLKFLGLREFLVERVTAVLRLQHAHDLVYAGFELKKLNLSFGAKH